MKILGITSLGHDASISLVIDNEIIFASHAERYSRIKNDGNINQQLINDALKGSLPDQIVWYEKPIIKYIRQLTSGQFVPYRSVSTHLNSFNLRNVPIKFVNHHESHAAGGYYTSPFKECAILVIDAIGEFDTISLWHGNGNIKKIWSVKYPHSLGLLYSAFTKRCGLTPNEEEYILMGMSAYGKPLLTDDIKNDFLLSQDHEFRLQHSVHKGIQWWKDSSLNCFDAAASVQAITEEYLISLCRWVKEKLKTDNLVLTGGVALNCVANSKIADIFNDIWIMPNPGDAGSSLGAIAAFTKQKLNWTTPYLGYDIKRQLDYSEIVDRLCNNEIIGIANGRAEFGPRALGNRSIICNPKLFKNTLNKIKRREEFRPFAPVIKEQLALEYFEMPVEKSPYMQFVAKIKHDGFPAITHVDGTSRVQTLSYEQNPNFFTILDMYHKRTGCPMLLNTSLNVKGEPLVNTWEDAQRFSTSTGIQVF